MLDAALGADAFDCAADPTAQGDRLVHEGIDQADLVVVQGSQSAATESGGPSGVPEVDLGGEAAGELQGATGAGLQAELKVDVELDAPLRLQLRRRARRP